MAPEQTFIPAFQQKVNLRIGEVLMQLLDDRCGKDHIADGSGLYDKDLIQVIRKN